jgi:hypothetical protein
MAIAAGAPSGTIERGRGGFMRNAQGTPYITDPSGALVKSGDRKGQPKRLPYGSPSGAGKQIENTFNLTKWGERRVVMGIGIDLALIADCAAVAKLDPDSDEYKEAADRIVMRAKDAAQAGLAADRGTHGHALTEDHDEERDWIARAEAGEILGLDVEVQRALVKAWKDCVERNGLEILAVEASCVDDTWRLAGTLDRIARCTKSLRFALCTGEVVIVPEGTVVVLDVKSGRRRTRPKDGSVLYWQAYAIQIASYAQAVPYDLDTETRGEWPWPISQEHALIAHLDVLGAIEGNPSCELVYVDLAAGREHGGATWLAAKTWEDRRDVFSVAQLSDESAEVAPSAPQAPEEEPTPTDSTDGTASEGGGVPPTAAPALTPAEQRAAIDARGVPDEGGPAHPENVRNLQGFYEALDAAAAAWVKNLVIEAQHGQVPFHLKDHHTMRRYSILRGIVTLANNDGGDDETLRCVLAAVIGDVARFANVKAGHALGVMSADEAALFEQLCHELAHYEIPAEVDPATGHVVLRFPSLAAVAA